MEKCRQGLERVALCDPKEDNGGSSGPFAGTQTEDLFKELTDAVTQYLRPIHEEYLVVMDCYNLSNPKLFKVDWKLMHYVFKFTWGADFFKAPRPMLKRIYKDVSQTMNVTYSQTDFSDMMEYHHMEALSAKLSQIALGIALIQPDSVRKELGVAMNLIEDEQIYRHRHAYMAYKFLLETFRVLFSVLSEPPSEWASERFLPDYEGLSEKTKNVIKGLGVLFVKHFRAKPKERYLVLKEVHEKDPASFEWALYLSETLRLKRREFGAGRSKRPTGEELQLVDLTLTMEPKNPYVVMNLIDCIIDAVRECNGRFQCGNHVDVKDLDQAMLYLQTECRKITTKFNKNVAFISKISDYFLRYVPYSFFDSRYAGSLLESAYELNPEDPRTTHRLGIYSRMNLHDAEQSLEWFTKTLELDPEHFNATMDYFKSLLGVPKKVSMVARKMECKFYSDDILSWRPGEIAEFRFYMGLAQLVAGNDGEETLNNWMEALRDNEILFTLSDLEQNFTIYGWSDARLTAEKIRVWILDEYEKIKIRPVKTAAEIERKTCIKRMLDLMLATTVASRPEGVIGPYHENFKYRMEHKVVQHLLLEKITKV